MLATRILSPSQATITTQGHIPDDTAPCLDNTTSFCVRVNTRRSGDLVTLPVLFRDTGFGICQRKTETLQSLVTSSGGVYCNSLRNSVFSAPDNDRNVGHTSSVVVWLARMKLKRCSLAFGISSAPEDQSFLSIESIDECLATCTSWVMAMSNDMT